MVFSLSQSDTDLGNILADMPESYTDLTRDDSVVDAGPVVVNRVSMSQINWEQRKREVVSNTRVVISLQISAIDTSTKLGTVDDTVVYDGATMRILDTSESPEGQELRYFLGEEWSE